MHSFWKFWYRAKPLTSIFLIFMVLKIISIFIFMLSVISDFVVSCAKFFRVWHVIYATPRVDARWMNHRSTGERHTGAYKVHWSIEAIRATNQKHFFFKIINFCCCFVDCCYQRKCGGEVRKESILRTIVWLHCYYCWWWCFAVTVCLLVMHFTFSWYMFAYS